MGTGIETSDTIQFALEDIAFDIERMRPKRVVIIVSTVRHHEIIIYLDSDMKTPGKSIGSYRISFN